MNTAPHDAATVFARRPRLVALTVALVTVAGLAAFALMPRAEDPELQGRFATVTTFLPGADAARVEALITEPIEDALAEFEELRTYDSVSRAGVSIVTIELYDRIGGAAIDDGDFASDIGGEGLAPERGSAGGVACFSQLGGDVEVLRAVIGEADVEA